MNERMIATVLAAALVGGLIASFIVLTPRERDRLHPLGHEQVVAG